MLRIADFGAAARLASHDTKMGEFTDVVGTIAFMAPEVGEQTTELENVCHVHRGSVHSNTQLFSWLELWYTHLIQGCI